MKNIQAQVRIQTRKGTLTMSVHTARQNGSEEHYSYGWRIYCIEDTRQTNRQTDKHIHQTFF